MKELLELLKNCESDEDINLFVTEGIEYYTKDSSERNKYHDTIGSLVGINPCEDSFKRDNLLYSICAWVGFVPKNTKIVYGTYTDNKKRAYTKGSYYYLDDESYLYEFAKFIKDKEVENLDDMILYVHKFLRLFLDKNIDYSVREDIHKLVVRSDNVNYYKPIKEHSITDFYHKGSALCTEYSIMGCNILSLFNIETIVFMDKEHAFNIIIDENDDACLLDFSWLVKVRDIYGSYVGCVPYYEVIDDFDNDYAQELAGYQRTMEFDDYELISVNDSLYKDLTGLVRMYGSDENKEKEKQLIL